MSDASSLQQRPLAWLYAPGSLTRHLARVCLGQLWVEVIAEGWREADVGVARDLEVRPGTRVWRREVRLGCGSTPYVHAITLSSASGARALGLARLGRRPLGHLLFRKGARRLRREVIRARPGQTWARRTLYLLRGHRLVVQEAFLPGLPPFR
ncbi:MAG: chorismate lyase [Pseudomonadota bacterium]